MPPKMSLRQTAARLLQRLGSLPELITTTARERRRKARAHEQEAERLDRIREPWKYRGK